jgi:hypothetical protein
MPVMVYLVPHQIGQREFIIITQLCLMEKEGLGSLTSSIAMLENYHLMMMVAMMMTHVQVKEKLGVQE